MNFTLFPYNYFTGRKRIILIMKRLIELFSQHKETVLNKANNYLSFVEISVIAVKSGSKVESHKCIIT